MAAEAGALHLPTLEAAARALLDQQDTWPAFHASGAVGLIAPGAPGDDRGASWDVLERQPETAVTGTLAERGPQAAEGASIETTVPALVVSPGLARDAAAYRAVLECLPGVRCHQIPAEPTDGVDLEIAWAALEVCQYVVAFESLGTRALVRRLRQLKCQGVLRRVVWVPNLEALDGESGRWRATLANLDVVDIVVAKVPSLVDTLTRMWPSLANACERAVSRPPTFILVGHCSPAPRCLCDQASESERVIRTSQRTGVIHFAGSSGSKNTLECCRAGISLVRRHKPFLTRVTICISAKWVHASGEHSPATAGGLAYGLADDEMTELRATVAANSDVAELCLSDYISEDAKARLYATCRLALCCSNAEGFGHYILEAAAHGCLVVTTDGTPMRDVLAKPTAWMAKASLKVTVAAYARPAAATRYRFGTWYTVPADEIVRAAEADLPLRAYGPTHVAACVELYRWRQRCLVRGLVELARTMGLLQFEVAPAAAAAPGPTEETETTAAKRPCPEREEPSHARETFSQSKNPG